MNESGGEMKTKLKTKLDKQFDLKRVIKVPIENIRVNTWNPKEPDTPEYEKIKKSIKINGLKGFIAVRLNPQNGIDYEILDGHQRFTAAKELNYKEVYVYNEGEIDDKTAKEYTIWWQQQVPFDRIQEASLVNELIKEYGDYESLPYSDAEINEMKMLSEFSFEEYEDAPDDEKDKDYKLTFVFPDKNEAHMIADFFNVAHSSREDLLIKLVQTQNELHHKQ
jgi:hypothetical protein